MSIDQHIEELRAELRNAVYRDERQWIKAELAKTIAERDHLGRRLRALLRRASLLGRHSSAPCRLERR
ncbi:hypothetical protein WKW50_24960 [Ochrobactrum sp. GPK 3]|uniref:hypothetical protein n=1 Tax=Brucella sp. 22210 TaxID=3453892 RepID=UPI0031384E92